MECQYEPQSVWMYQTSCCACGGQTCPACICAPDCQYQPSSVWSTSTHCCGCTSLAQFKTQKKLISHKDVKEDSGALQSQSFNLSTHCGIECQYEPSSIWYTSTSCCACGGQTCPACVCAPDCQYQPSSVWSTSTHCCGC